MSPIPWRNKQQTGPEGDLSPLAALRGEMDRLFDKFVRETASWEWPFSTPRAWSPSVDMAENENLVTIRVELPGVDPQDVEVNVSSGQLIISGEKQELTGSTGEDLRHTESRYGAFRRVIPLPEGIDPDQIEAEYVNGVLIVRLKKAPASPPKRIDIKVKP